ncbi:hypothetical protein ACEWY4_022162 [Coilia grayii]|uniref:C2H2-type domain-containing protein n=1 Tax=Coilia grayii TaxID=363190 RepID=A0ABD1J698_9TELE
MTETLSAADYWSNSRWNHTDVYMGSENVKVFCAPGNLDKQPRHGTVAKGKAHQCMVCSKYFSSPYKLRRHQLTHTGERPFKCAVCDKAFRQLSHLKLHSQSHCRSNAVKNKKALVDHLDGPAPRSPLEAYSAQLHGTTAVNSPTHTDVPDFARFPNFTLMDSSPSKILDQTYAKHPLTIESLYEINQTGEQHLSSTLQVKDLFDCNGMTSLDQNMAERDYKDQTSKVPHPKKLGPGISQAVVHMNSDDKKQTLPSNVAKSPKPHKVLGPGQKQRSSQKGMYECQTCLKRFSVPSKLQRHMLCHTGQRPFACQMCGRSFRQLCHLKLHLRTRACLKQTSKPVKKKDKNVSRNISGGNKSLTAAVSEMYADSSENDCTTRVQNSLGLGTCGPDLSVVERVKGKSLHSSEPVPHDSGCLRQVGAVGGHSDQMPKTSCSNLPEPPQLNTFRIVHECPVCLKCFTSPSKLKRHCLIHTGQRPFQCYMCQRAFRQLAHLKVHYKVHERSGSKTPFLQKRGAKTHPSRAATPQQKAFTCNHCGWKFRHPTHLTVHLQNHKNLVAAKPVNNQIKTSKDQNPLSSQMHRSYETTTEHVSDSNVCIRKMNLNSGSSKTQLNTGGYRPSPHCCTVCFKCFDSASRLQRHSLNHTDLRPFKCLSCSRAFRQRAHLRLHRCLSTAGTQLMTRKEDSNMTCNVVLNECIQSVNHCRPAKQGNVGPVDVLPMQELPHRAQENHSTSLDVVRGKRYTPVIPETTNSSHKSTLRPTKQKGYACSICQRCFSVPSKLARHLLIHMGIKPFTCEVCGRSFRQACHLQTHLNIHRKKKCTAALGSRESVGQGVDSLPRRWSAPPNNALVKVNAVTKQNAVQKNLPQMHGLDSPVSKKAGKSEHLCPSKCDQSFAKNLCGDRSVKNTVNQCHRVTSAQHYSVQSGSESNEANSGIFTVRELNNYAPEFVSMHPITHGVQNSNADACPENQIFIDLPFDDTTAQHKDPSCRTEGACRKSTVAQKVVKKRANCCSICLKKFDSPSKLARHFLIHMGLRPYKCQVCAKTFRQRCHLQTHMRIHSKVAPDAGSCDAQSQPASDEVESTSNGQTVDVDLHLDNPTQAPRFSHEKQSPYKDHYENHQPLVSFVHESDHSEIENSFYGFDNIRDQKQEKDHFTGQSLTQPFPAQDKQNCTVSQQNMAKMFSGQLPHHPHDPLEIKHISNISSYACTSYPVANGTLDSTNKVDFDYIMEKRGDSGDDGQGLTERSHISSSPAVHAPFKEEIFELRCEREGVDSRLSKPPNDLLICPSCSQCFQTERKLRLHRCVSRQAAEERQKAVSGYQCAICFKSFQVPSKLKRHYVIHTGHRPFQCSVCSKTFTQSAHLKTHLLTHNKEKG